MRQRATSNHTLAFSAMELDALLRQALAKATAVQRDAAQVPALKERVRELEQRVRELEQRVAELEAPQHQQLARLPLLPSGKRTRPSSEAGSAAASSASASASASTLRQLAEYGPVTYEGLDVGELAHEVGKRLDTLQQPHLGASTDGWQNVSAQSMPRWLELINAEALPSARRKLLFAGCGECFEAAVLALSSAVPLEMICVELNDALLRVGFQLLRACGAVDCGGGTFRLRASTLRLSHGDAATGRVRCGLVYCAAPSRSLVAALATAAYNCSAAFVVLKRQANHLADFQELDICDVKLAGSHVSVRLARGVMTAEAAQGACDDDEGGDDDEADDDDEGATATRRWAARRRSSRWRPSSAAAWR